MWQISRPRRRAPLPGISAGEAAQLPPPPAPAVRPDLERVFRAEYARVVGIARRVLGDDRQAEDVAQDVFLAFGRAAVPAEQASGWLAVAASHTALNTLRAEGRRVRRESTAARPDRAPDVAEQVLTEDARARVRAALGQLPRSQALALVLRHSGLSYNEIGAWLGIPVSGVGTTLRRAEAAVRKELDDHGTPG